MRLIACVARVVWCGGVRVVEGVRVVVVTIVVMTGGGRVSGVVWLVILLNVILIIILGGVGYGVGLGCGYAQVIRALPLKCCIFATSWLKMT